MKSRVSQWQRDFADNVLATVQLAALRGTFRSHDSIVPHPVCEGHRGLVRRHATELCSQLQISANQVTDHGFVALFFLVPRTASQKKKKVSSQRQ